MKQEIEQIQKSNKAQEEAVKCLKHDAAVLAHDNVVSLSDYRELLGLAADAHNIQGNVLDDELSLVNEMVVLEARLLNIEDGIRVVKECFRKEKRKVVSLERFRSQAEGSK